MGAQLPQVQQTASPAPAGHRGSVRWYVAAVAGLGVATVAVAIAGWEEGLERPGLFVALTAAFALNEALPLFLLRQLETESLALEEGFLVAMSLLLPWYATVASFAIAVTTGNILRRLPTIKVVFNSGQLVASAGLALVVVEVLSPADLGPLGPRHVLAAVAGAATFFVANGAALAAVIALVERTSFRRAFVGDLGVSSFLWAENVAVGSLAGLVSAAFPWAVPYSLVAMAALHLSFAAHLQARRDRERITGLLEAATSAHATMKVEDVERSVADSAGVLLASRRSRIARTPPGEGELGARLHTMGGAEEWLIVSDPRIPRAFDPSDQRLLEALAAIAAVALDNARLFEERRQMLGHLMAAQQEERERIAADIHDDPVQELAAVRLRLATLGGRLKRPQDLDLLSALRTSVERCVNALRSLIFDLHPPSLEFQGVASALEEYLKHVGTEADFAYRLENRLTREPEGQPRVVIYRIAQEALANVRKHARASRVEVLLEERERGVLVRITDDGAGFSPEVSIQQPRPGHVGLKIMRQRAEMAGGWFRIESAPGHGSAVEFWVPMGAVRPGAGG